MCVCVCAHVSFYFNTRSAGRGNGERKLLGLGFVFEWIEDRFTTHGRNN